MEYLTKNILIIEDDAFNKIVINDMVEILYKNINIFQADDGVIGLEILKNQKIDLILSDINMPNMDGYAFIKELQKLDLKIPTIAITAYAIKGDMEKILSCGYTEYLSKPIDFARLKEILKKYLD